MSGLDGLGWPNPEDEPQRRPSDAATCSAIRERYTSLSKAGRKYMAYLEIDHQSFPVCVEYTTKKRAEWFRDMLAIALQRMISQNIPDNPPR